MNAEEILNELPNLAAPDRDRIANRLRELSAQPTPKRGTVGDLIRIYQEFPGDPAFADILEQVYHDLRREPARNPWD